jgi:hypothetical protein
MNLAGVLSTLVLASSVAVSSTPVPRQLLSMSPGDFAERFNAVAQQSRAQLTLPVFKTKPGWHRADASSGVAVMVRATESGHALDEVVVVCREVPRCFPTIATAAQAIDAEVDPNLIQHFVVARISTQLGPVGLVISGLAYIVVTSEDDDYVALIIRPYAPQSDTDGHVQAARPPLPQQEA